MNHKYFMEQALNEAKYTLDKGLFPVSCVLVYKRKVIATSSLKGVKINSLNELHHAEIRALHRLYKLQDKINKTKVTLFCTFEPCLMCFSTIIIAGINKIVYAYEDVMGGGTNLDIKHLKHLYQKRKITIVPNILRDKSVEFFKAFFSDPEEDYLRGTLLAKYTLKQ